MVKVALPGPRTPLGEATGAALRARGHDVSDALDAADVVVDVAGDVGSTRRTLERLGGSAAAPTRYVLLSSATVYGAWPANPVPLPEASPVRPNPGFRPAVEAAEAERLVAEWAGSFPERRAAVLRPAIIAGERPLDPVARALAVGGGRPLQVVAEDDVAGAVAVVVDGDLDGTFNVAPDGSIPPETVDALVGAPPRLGPLEPALEGLRRLRPAVVPGLAPYLEHPWVVANDRLRTAGWEPRATNEEALVAASTPSWWRDLSPKRRQEVALGGAAVGVTGAAAAVVLAVRAVLRRRR